MKKLNTKGFTMVELLATVTILGIIMTVTIGSAIKLIQQARDDSMEQQQKLVSVAAESYFQSHKEQLPKLIGETTKVPINVLVETNYLKESIKNSKGESCMEKSYVTAQKKSKSSYIYKVYLYCGNDNVPTENLPTPNITIDFCKEENGVYKCKDKDGVDVTNDVTGAFISIAIDGNKSGEEQTNLEGYSWSILAAYKGETELKEIYNSGNLSASGKKTIYVPKKENLQKYILKNYLDITNETKIVVKVIATNAKGGITEKESVLMTYKDGNAPQCLSSAGEAISDNDWLNKENTESTSRTITVGCTDGNESGCIRDTFTQSWPNSNEKSAEFSNVIIRDNAGNENSCRVRVNVDTEAPVITLNNVNPIGTSDNVLNSTTNTTQGTENDSMTLNYNQYQKLNNSWMNFENYQQGVIYTFSIADNINLANWKFDTNIAGLSMLPSENPNTNLLYNVLAATNEDAIQTQSISEQSTTIQVSFLNDGIRRGQLTVTDKAGNTATYIIEANLDRVAPKNPSVYLRKWKNNSTTPTGIENLEKYTEGTWSNKNVYTEAQQEDDDMSGIDHIEYAVNAGSTMVATTWNAKNDGDYNIKYSTCDKAGNCSLGDEKNIKIDKTAPPAPIIYMRKWNNNSDARPTTMTGMNTEYTSGWTNKKVYTEAQKQGEDNLSGISHFELITEGATTNHTASEHYHSSYWNKERAYWNVQAEGESTLKYKLCDNAGNCSAVTSATTKTIKFDKTAPPAPIIYMRKWNNNSDARPTTMTGMNTEYTSGWTNKKVYTEAQKQGEDNLSGISHFELITEGATTNHTASEHYHSSYWNKERAYWNVQAEGESTLKYKLCDNAGNCSAVTSNTTKIVKFDKTMPQGSYTCIKLNHKSSPNDSSKPETIPSYDKLAEKGFFIDQGTKDYIEELRYNGCEEGKACNYSIIIQYNDNFSGNRIKRSINCGDQDQSSEWRIDDGTLPGASPVIDHPGADQENVIILKDICDQANNCLYENNELTIDCKGKINENNPIIGSLRN